jgi:hypothetical protein
MVGDNDARAFGTYTQAGQDYGTTLPWTRMLLVSVLYVNQEMVLRLGAVTSVGHARLVPERLGEFLGAFSVIDPFPADALTVVTEFIVARLSRGCRRAGAGAHHRAGNRRAQLKQDAVTDHGQMAKTSHDIHRTATS